MRYTKSEKQLARLKRLGKSQVWLASETGLNESYISLWFKYETRPEVGEAIEKALTKAEGGK
jgi:hypothetical protein